TYNRLFQTASKHASSNAELKRDLVKAQSQNNHLSRELLNHRKTAEKNIKLSQENRKLKDKVKMLDEQVKMDKETYNRLFQTASKHASSNAELKRDLVKAQSQNNHLSRELLNHRKTAEK
ncbi:hypothetical protein ACFKJH_10860, partial [Streptococcus agalactiae]